MSDFIMRKLINIIKENTSGRVESQQSGFEFEGPYQNQQQAQALVDEMDLEMEIIFNDIESHEGESAAMDQRDDVYHYDFEIRFDALGYNLIN